MSKRLILVLALAFVAAITLSAYAEVQNVKVSGDITVAGVSRSDFDLVKTVEPYSIVGSSYEDKENDLLSIARVRVDADLTDNVSTTVRLLSERNWNGESTTGNLANRNIGFATANTPSTENQVDLDLAYVTLKEFLYSPLSLSIGRQELRFGNGLVVGDPDTNLYSAKTALAEGDLSARKSFDAIRVILDYNPLVVDGFYAKLAENTSALNDDTDLMGLNARYELNKNTTVEGFFFSKTKGANAVSVYNIDSTNTTGFTAGSGATVKDRTDIVHTVGARVVDKSIKNLSIDAQGAYQFGRYNPRFDPNARWIANTNKAETGKRSAWALQTGATYDLKDILLSKYSPSISGNYAYFSGANRDQTGVKAYKGWDPMFEDQTYGHIMNAIFAQTNMHRGSFSAKAKLVDDLALNLDYTLAWFAKKYADQRQAVLSGVAGTASGTTGKLFRITNGSRYIGQEIDAKLTYDYTEDVQFSLLGGVLITGKNVHGNTDSTRELDTAAKELIGSMKVTF